MENPGSLAAPVWLTMYRYNPFTYGNVFDVTPGHCIIREIGIACHVLAAEAVIAALLGKSGANLGGFVRILAQVPGN